MNLKKDEKMFNDIMNKQIAPLLKSFGYKKSGLTWNKHAGDIIHVINIQSDSHNNQSFTINLGIFDKNIWKICWGKETPKFVNEEDCFPRFRIGDLLSDFSDKGTDFWWSCNSSTNEQHLGNEILDMLKNKCIPLLERSANINLIEEFLTKKGINLMPIEKIYLGIIKYKLDKIISSNELFDQVSDISQSWAKRIEFVNKQLKNN